MAIAALADFWARTCNMRYDLTWNSITRLEATSGNFSLGNIHGILGKSLRSTFSSLKIRKTIIGIYKKNIGAAHQDPSAIGVSRYMTKVPKYIG
jgi:hypothetical protein